MRILSIDPPQSSFRAITPLGMAEEAVVQVHVDYAGPFLGSMFLVLVDAHSKWMDVYNTGQASTALMTVRKLRDSFVQHGLPD